MLINGKPGDMISIRDRGLLYGDGVFRTLRASCGQALHWPLHYRKLQHDCRALGLACPDEALLRAELDMLLAQHPDGVVKLIVTRGTGTRGYTPLANIAPTRTWDISPSPQYPADNARQGVKVRLCNLRLSAQPLLAGIKHLNRLENVLAAAEWSDPEIAEGLLLDTENHVIEGTRSNLFMVSQGRLITPDLSRCGVAGVQRERVLDWARQYGMAVEVCDIALEDLWQADELFLSNSLIGLWPIRELEQSRWSDFPFATQIRQSLEEART
jgi:4-amino-4-deoxychorismate lyase